MPTPIQQALQLASDRGIMPTSLGAAEIRDLERSMLERAFWSARTTNAGYVRELKGLVDRYVSGEGYDNDLAKLRVEARELLAKYGYTPERGFPGDAERGVPPAAPGSLQDLSSERRLNLIFETQASLMRGLGQKLRGLDRADVIPAWELVRYQDRRVPRDWLERWEIAADNVEHAGVYDMADSSRMVARKDSPIWAALGSSALFDDALDVDHAPFAFNSGMGWLEVFPADLRAGGAVLRAESGPGAATTPGEAIPEEEPTPPEDLFIGGAATLQRLAERLRARQAAAEQARESE